MTTKANAAQSTSMIIGPARFSYLNALVAKAAPGSQKAKFSVCLLIPKKDKDLKKRIDAAIAAAVTAGADKLRGTKQAKWKMPLRDGDEERDDDENYAGHWFINASSDQKPGFVDKDRQPILDAEEIYSGMYGRASVNFYAFNTAGNVGIACGLNNLQKLKDGENLTGRKRAEDDFADGAVFEDEADDLD